MKKQHPRTHLHFPETKVCLFGVFIVRNSEPEGRSAKLNSPVTRWMVSGASGLGGWVLWISKIHHRAIVSCAGIVLWMQNQVLCPALSSAPFVLSEYTANCDDIVANGKRMVCLFTFRPNESSYRMPVADNTRSRRCAISVETHKSINLGRQCNFVWDCCAFRIPRRRIWLCVIMWRWQVMARAKSLK